MNMLEFINAKTHTDIETVSALATEIMQEHYDPIVGKEINAHMLAKYQSVEGICEEIKDGAEYFFVRADGANVGFLAIAPKDGFMYLSKFYLAKKYRGNGYSKDMMMFVKARAEKCGLNKITLNVNADNGNTVSVYRRFRFEIVEEIYRDVVGGYCVHDYVMQCNLKNSQE